MCFNGANKDCRCQRVIFFNIFFYTSSTGNLHVLNINKLDTIPIDGGHVQEIFGKF